MKNVIERGYTVIYDTAKGEIGFIGIDDHSGGYPYFSSWVETRNVFTEIGKAYSLLRSAQKMGTYYGASDVHFGTMRVVKMTNVFEEVDEQDDKKFLEQTLKKLNQSEIDVLKRHIESGGAR